MATSRPASTGLLIHWVKEYRDQNGGKLPTPSSLPSELAPIYLEWLASVRNGAGKEKAKAASAVRQSDSPLDNHVATDKRETSFLSRGESYSVDTHVSDTPHKSIQLDNNDTECTSRQAATLPLFHDDFQSEQQHCPAEPTSSMAGKPSRGLRNTARNLGAHDSPKQPKKYRASNKENSAQLQTSMGVSSPFTNALKSPLSPVRGPIAQHSPSRVRQGAVKRKVAFSAFARVQEQSSSASFALSPLAAPSHRTKEQNELHGAASAEASQQHQVSEEQALVRANSCKADTNQASSEQPLLLGSKCSLTNVQPEKEEMNAGQMTAEILEQHKEGSEVLNKSSTPEVIEDVFEFPVEDQPPSSSLVVQKPVAGKPRKISSTAAKVVRRTVEEAPAALSGSSEPPVEQKSAALKRKRMNSHCNAAGSDSKVSLECSEVFSESDAEMTDGESESESDRRPKPKATTAKRARPSSNKGLTVAQLKQRLSEQGLSTGGRKADLEERLRDACNDQAGASTSAGMGNQKAHGPAQVSRVPNKQSSSGVFKGGKRKNFVRINLKGPSAKGKFQSKGARKFGKKRFSRFGRYQTKMLPQAGQGADYVEGCSSRSVACFKCGAEGHWARDCPGLPDPPAQAEAREEGFTDTAQLVAPEAPKLAMPAAAVPVPEEAMREDALTETLQAVFGFDAFRGLQLPVIQSVLQGTSTLAVLPTGAGKSLCYQVPALLCGGLVLVVSPLIALMKDQLAHLPKGLPGAMLWSGQQASQAMQTLRDIREGKVRVLYVAPERMGSPSLLSALAPMLPLPLVCIDEAHCIAEWGHNFRSAYFRLGRMLRENIPCRAVLALTATATKATEHSMVQALGISPSAVFRDASLRDNLRFHVHHTNGGTEAGHSKAVLLKLLKPGGALADKKAVVVYTTFQVQAEQVAAHLHSHGIPAAAYHAGKHFKERESVQEMFGKGRLRVVVATVAFGMGVDNRGVQAVVHLTLPQSLEEYVQQVGRAGRDGSEAMCHLFLDDADFRRLRSLSHSDAVSAASVMQFLETVFPPGELEEDAPQAERDCYAVLGSEEMACTLDMKAEVMETLLTYLEAHEESYVRVLPSVGRTVKVSFFNSTCQELAPRQPSLQSLLAVCPKPRGGTYTINMARWANEAQAAPSALLQQLAALARQDELRFEVDSKPTLTFQVVKRPASLEELAEALAERHTEVGRRRLRRLDTVYKMLAAAAAKPNQAAQEQQIRQVAQQYFEAEDDSSGVGQSTAPGETDGLPLVAGSNFMAKDVRMLLRESASMKVAAQLTGRAVARILHGLSSSAFPAAQWKKCGYWGRYGDVDFEAVLAVAEAEVQAWSN